MNSNYYNSTSSNGAGVAIRNYANSTNNNSSNSSNVNNRTSNSAPVPSQVISTSSNSQHLYSQQHAISNSRPLSSIGSKGPIIMRNVEKSSTQVNEILFYK